MDWIPAIYLSSVRSIQAAERHWRLLGLHRVRKVHACKTRWTRALLMGSSAEWYGPVHPQERVPIDVLYEVCGAKTDCLSKSHNRGSRRSADRLEREHVGARHPYRRH